MKTIIITPPAWLKDEAIICNSLFASRLEFLHLRKPGTSPEEYEKFILQIEPRYRNRIVIHEHYTLAQKYQLRGIHLKSDMVGEHARYPGQTISISCHSLEEINQLPFQPAYCFLSPVFDSISKKGYTTPFSKIPQVNKINIPVIALGGVTPDKTDLCREAGFAGVAALGYIWEKPEEALQRFIRLRTPFVMSIAGFDPSGGAGVTADTKTFEATGSYGLGICSAITFQNENQYEATQWIPLKNIRKQCELQFRNHRPEYIKIGLIENFEILEQLTEYLTTLFPKSKLIWDPILKASAGYIFHEQYPHISGRIFKNIFLITPNTEELYQLFGQEITPEKLQGISRQYQINILWKGGHNQGKDSTDTLITPEGLYHYSVSRSPYGKHGTGCVLSAAITSALAQGYSLPEACSKAQLYVSKFINSHDGPLGFHFTGDTLFTPEPSPQCLQLQYITAPKEGMTIAGQVEAVCRGGLRWVQLRMKGASVAEILAEGKIVKEICRRYHALFIINDNVQAAKELDADGVHLGKEDMDPIEARRLLGKDKIIGATCNTWADILLRHQQQVDYIGLGPFTFTTTKEKLSPVLGQEGYSQIMQLMHKNHITIPVFAIGGITEADIPSLMQTGIQGIALSGLIKNSPDPTRKTGEIIHLLNNSKN